MRVTLNFLFDLNNLLALRGLHSPLPVVGGGLQVPAGFCLDFVLALLKLFEDLNFFIEDILIELVLDTSVN